MKFAIYLTKYPHIKILYHENELNVDSIIESRSILDVGAALESQYEGLVVEVVEWTTRIDGSMILCDDQGIALHEVTDDLPRQQDISYTVYVQWAGFVGVRE